MIPFGMKRREFLQTSAVSIVGTTMYATTASGKQNEDPNPIVVSQFAPPKPNARGITFDGKSLWIGHKKSNGDLIYEVGTDGRIKQSFSFPGDDTTPDIYGITALNDHLFAVGEEFVLYESRQGVLYKLTKQGERVTRYETSGSFGYNGMASDGTRLFVSKAEKIVRVLTTAANQYRSIAVPQEFNGLCYDGTNFWGTASNKIFKFAPDGTIKQRFSYPADSGIGIAHDGRYLYMIDKDENRVFKLDPDVSTPTASPTPTPTPTASPTPTATTEEPTETSAATSTEIPGFGLGTGMAGLGTGLGLVRVLASLTDGDDTDQSDGD